MPLIAKAATLQSIASRLNLSKTTVSVALRGRPGVSETMRARIVAEAKHLGYQPNAVASELMALVRARKKPKAAIQIAFINTFREDPSLLHRLRGLREFFEGAKDQAAVFGYELREFRAFEAGMTPARLDRMLKGRGIRSILMGPRWLDEPDIALDWGAYSCVLLGETSYGAGIHRVCNHHMHSCELALTQIANLGYKRIGVLLCSDYESPRRFDFLAGVEPTQRKVGETATFIVRVQDHPNYLLVHQAPPEKRNELYKAQLTLHEIPKLAEWTLKERLDAIITLDAYDATEIRRIPTISGRPLGYAMFAVTPDEACAGVNHHPMEIGRIGVELLRGLLHSGERGLKPRPRIVLVEGEWIDGPTAPRISA